ncbi:unnamed protein product [Vitrella brassicaformis CCMP3155]|uniref:Uncharacterized protein n=1 Tax=Vitrella brassicaformis (strain CCMP3155) TaxID=1169540 RepID=A0A0G4EMY2_VITBC|nr:unnamed protein product [Vitrella brassicaformis CCMP3155]|eukprot:CEL98174.1 unnamed protein product [Vitrella brassicaformis CCMP3155]
MVAGALLLMLVLLPFILPSASGFVLPSPSQRLRAPAAQKVTRLSQEQQREAYDWALTHIEDIVSLPFFIEGTIDSAVPVIRGKTGDWALDLSENPEEDLKAAYASATQSPVGLLGEEPADRVDFEHRKSREFAASDLQIEGTMAGCTYLQYYTPWKYQKDQCQYSTNDTWTAVIEEICQEAADRNSPGSEVKAELYKALAIALEYEYTPSSIGMEYLKGRDRLLYDILAEHFNISLEIIHQNWRALPDVDGQ